MAQSPGLNCIFPPNSISSYKSTATALLGCCESFGCYDLRLAIIYLFFCLYSSKLKIFVSGLRLSLFSSSRNVTTYFCTVISVEFLRFGFPAVGTFSNQWLTVRWVTLLFYNFINSLSCYGTGLHLISRNGFMNLCIASISGKYRKELTFSLVIVSKFSSKRFSWMVKIGGSDSNCSPFSTITFYPHC